MKHHLLFTSVLLVCVGFYFDRRFEFFDIRLERGSNIPPYFIEQLYNIIVIEGQDTQLDACAQGFPEPKVAWEKEGLPLTPNKEYK